MTEWTLTQETAYKEEAQHRAKISSKHPSEKIFKFILINDLVHIDELTAKQ